jgi:hypothetical protein
MKIISKIAGWIDYGAFAILALPLIYSLCAAFAIGVMAAVKTLFDIIDGFFSYPFFWQILAVILFCVGWCVCRWKHINSSPPSN